MSVIPQTVFTSEIKLKLFLHKFVQRREWIALSSLILLCSTKRIPVLYIFGRESSIDTGKCLSAFKELFPDQLSHILVMYDVRYSCVIGKIINYV